MADAYPLQWPVGRQRWGKMRVPSAFKMKDSAMVNHLLDELERLKATDVVISTNRAPYSRATRFEDPGVAVYFKRQGQELCIACDKWTKIEDNIHSVGLAVEAIRGMERWGTSDMVDAAFSGFAALPAGSADGDYLPGNAPWYETLGVSQNAPKDEVKKAYHLLAQKYHPDKGGTDTEWQRLTVAYERGMQA